MRNGVQTDSALTEEGIPFLKPQAGHGRQQSTWLGGPSTSQGGADPKAPGASPGLTTPHRAGAWAPWAGAIWVLSESWVGLGSSGIPRAWLQADACLCGQVRA